MPSADQLQFAADRFDRDWGAVDEALYGVCARSPGHGDLRTVTAKIALVGRAYSAGLERCVTPPPGVQAITVIADHLHSHGGEVDHLIAELRKDREPLDADAMSRIVDCHGRFTALLGATPGCHRMPRSFAAKYLHFHHAAVPIYDSYAATRLGKVVRWDSGDIPVSRPHGADQEYWAFCVRLFRLYHACRQRNLSVTIKGLDAYLWQVPL